MHIFMTKEVALGTITNRRVKVLNRGHSHKGRGNRAFVRVDGMMRRECESCLERDEVSVSA